MSKVEISIGGRDFSFTCSPEDQERVRGLATAIDEHFQPLAPRFSQNLLFACLRAADDVFEQAGVAPGEDPEAKRMRERLAEVEEERDRLETALSAATDARGRLERDMRIARDEAANRDEAERKAQAERIAMLEKRCSELQDRLEAAQSHELPFAKNGEDDDPDLLPALERFATLLESCADKLETRQGSA
ncbi:cell division protein ZapA [Alteriqipengyuania sp. 357]